MKEKNTVRFLNILILDEPCTTRFELGTGFCLYGPEPLWEKVKRCGKSSV